jgi:hypothetical protein
LRKAGRDDRERLWPTLRVGGHSKQARCRFDDLRGERRGRQRKPRPDNAE